MTRADVNAEGRGASARQFRPVMPRLERRRRVDVAWRSYVEEGLPPLGIRDEIARSWRRSRDVHRIDPRMTRPDRVLSTEALAVRRERDEVFRLASPILIDFARRLALHDTVLAYLDGDGWMLSIDGDEHTVEQLKEIDFRPGVQWSEEAAGTNAPGTALAERTAVEVLASEHFVSAWHPWSCAAAPVLAPGDGTPVGLVDVTAPWEVQRRHALLIAKAIARAIEERVRAALSVRDEVVRYAFVAAHGAGDALAAVDTRGRVIRANDVAARRRFVEAGALSTAAQESVLATLRAPSAEVDGDVRVWIPEGRSLVVTPVRYAGSTVGAVVRLREAVPVARPRARPSARYDFARIEGQSEPLCRAIELARTAARNALPVVIWGESGTGKELFAHAIHSGGDRCCAPFVAVNCGSIPVQLVESELFGYEAGTFTGGRVDGSPGRFENATGGTLFLDEVSELPPPAQAALLRVLQEREVVRVGGSSPRPVDVRVVAASNKRLDEEVRAGRFRRDLYYRLAVLSITVPPLRDRGDDVALLARIFLAEAEAEVGRGEIALAPDAVDALCSHSWPGNVRELKNVILRAAATAPGPRISAADLALDPCRASGVPPTRTGGAGGTLKAAVLQSERAALVAALDAAGWNFASAAGQLGISRMTLYRRLQRHGITRAPASR